MILFRNRLIIGLIWKTIKVFFTVIYGILEFLSLQYTLLIGLIGVVLYFTGALDNNRVVLVIFCLILALSLIYAVISSIKKLLGIDKKVKRSKGVQIVSNNTENQSQEHNEQEANIEVQNTIIPPANQYPKYFKVKQNPAYVMAEYQDRYELYKIENGKLVRVRIDYKNQGDYNGRIF